MRKLFKILSLIPVLYLILLPAYMVIYTNSLPCRGININISDSSEYDFITKNELLNLAYSGGTRILGQPISKVEIAGIEKKIAESN